MEPKRAMVGSSYRTGSKDSKLNGTASAKRQTLNLSDMKQQSPIDSKTPKKQFETNKSPNKRNPSLSPQSHFLTYQEQREKMKLQKRQLSMTRASAGTHSFSKEDKNQSVGDIVRSSVESISNLLSEANDHSGIAQEQSFELFKTTDAAKTGKKRASLAQVAKSVDSLEIQKFYSQKAVKEEKVDLPKEDIEVIQEEEVPKTQERKTRKKVSSIPSKQIASHAEIKSLMKPKRSARQRTSIQKTPSINKKKSLASVHTIKLDASGSPKKKKTLAKVSSKSKLNNSTTSLSKVGRKSAIKPKMKTPKTALARKSEKMKVFNHREMELKKKPKKQQRPRSRLRSSKKKRATPEDIKKNHIQNFVKHNPLKYRIIAFAQNCAARKIQTKWQHYAKTRSE